MQALLRDQSGRDGETTRLRRDQRGIVEIGGDPRQVGTIEFSQAERSTAVAAERHCAIHARRCTSVGSIMSAI
ncbi:MAG: hypothetical protein ACT4P7_02530 [Gemmatimonadaceae bacterium]